MYQLVISLIAILLILVPGIAAKDLVWSGKIRHRAEWVDKDFSNNTNFGGFDLLRSRLDLSFKDDHSLAFFQLQDSRKFGTEKNTLTDGTADALDFHQAYLKIDNILGQPLSVKAGRMEMIYANQRLIGAVGWHNIGRSFDGAMVTYAGDKFNIDLFNMKLTENSMAGDSGDVNFQGLWATASYFPKTRVDVYYLNDVTAPGDDFNRKTMGVYSKGSYTFGGIVVFQESDYALQSGKQTKDQDIEASLLGIRVGAKIKEMPFSPSVGFGYDALSGDAADTDNKYEAFNTLYATNHKYYGFMDYFLNVPLHAKGYGLNDLIVSGGFSPFKKISVKVDFHTFSTAEKVDGETAIGTELDVTVVFPYRTNVKIVGGYSRFTPDTVFKVWKGADPASWAYLMTIYTF